MIRPMTSSDVERVAALEARSFSSPWQAGTFQRLLGRPGAELWVLEGDAREVVAYAVLWCVLDQAELANIAVEPSARGMGFGGALLDHVLTVARDRGARSVFLEVRESNAVALEMYSRRGFREVGRRRGYYESPREDARVLELRIPQGKRL